MLNAINLMLFKLRKYRIINLVCYCAPKSWRYYQAISARSIKSQLPTAKHGLPFPLAIVIFAPNATNCKVGTYKWNK